jgi:hypothetical protein
MIAIIASKTTDVFGDLIEIILSVCKTRGCVKSKFFQPEVKLTILPIEQEGI